MDETWIHAPIAYFMISNLSVKFTRDSLVCRSVYTAKKSPAQRAECNQRKFPPNLVPLNAQTISYKQWRSKICEETTHRFDVVKLQNNQKFTTRLRRFAFIARTRSAERNFSKMPCFRSGRFVYIKIEVNYHEVRLYVYTIHVFLLVCCATLCE